MAARWGKCSFHHSLNKEIPSLIAHFHELNFKSKNLLYISNFSVSRKQSKSNFPKNKHFLPHDTHTITQEQFGLTENVHLIIQKGWTTDREVVAAQKIIRTCLRIKEHNGFTASSKLCRNLCSSIWLKPCPSDQQLDTSKVSEGYIRKILGNN